jgi:hypothetical protein
MKIKYRIHERDERLFPIFIAKNLPKSDVIFTSANCISLICCKNKVLRACSQVYFNIFCFYFRFVTVFEINSGLTVSLDCLLRSLISLQEFALYLQSAILNLFILRKVEGLKRILS